MGDELNSLTLAGRDYHLLANLEAYLVDVVGPHFRKTGELRPGDVWLIFVWKANRAKTKVRNTIEKFGGAAFVDCIPRIASDLYKATSPEDRLKALMESWGMRLPMASAVLTMLYPDDFTVYDWRVCEEIGGFSTLSSRTKWKNIWAGYVSFRDAVANAAPGHATLRQKDKYLWGASLLKGVKADLFAAIEAEEKDAA